MRDANCYEACCAPLAYICCGASAKVAIVNLAEARHVGDIPCGEGSDPFYIAISPNKKLAYVADYGRKRVLLLDLTCNRLAGQVAVVGRPRGLDLSPCGERLYVVFDDQPVMQIFGSALQSLGQMALPSSSGSVTVVNHGLLAYVTQPELNQTAVVDLCSLSVIRALETGASPGRMAYSDEDALLMVAGRESQTLTPVNTCGGYTCNAIALGGSPAGLAFTQGGRQCLVALRDENTAAVVDLCSGQVTARIPAGEAPGGVAASKVYPLAVVCSQISSTVSIINTQTMGVTAVLEVGNDPAGVAVTC